MELYFNCKTKTKFNNKERLCRDLLGLPNEGAEIYAKPLIDINGDYYLIINNEVASIITETELAACKEYNEIKLEQNDI